MTNSFASNKHNSTTISFNALSNCRNPYGIWNCDLCRPGEQLKPGEDEIEGLKNALTKQLSPEGTSPDEWQIGELLATWWRPNFETFMVNDLLLEGFLLLLDLFLFLLFLLLNFA